MEEKWWERPVAFLCNHLVISILAFLGSLAIIIFFAFQGNLQPVQELEPIASDELESLKPRLEVIASIYKSPANRLYNKQFLNIGEISEQPEKYQNQTQVFRGKLSKKTTIEGLKDDWPSASVVWIIQGKDEILGLYRGNTDNIEQGENVLVEGVYVAEGDGINIDSITSDSAQKEHNRSIITSAALFYIAAGITTLWTIFVLIRSTKKKVKPPHPLLFLLFFCYASFQLSSCNIQIQNIIDPSGQGTVITTICEERDSIEFFYKIPEAPNYLADRIANFRRAGGFYEEVVNGNEQCFTLQQNFSGSGDFSYTPYSQQEDIENWSYIDHTKHPQFDSFRYTAKVNTSSLYELNTSIDSAVRGEVQKSLDEINMVYSVNLPGNITYSNADRIEGNTGYWDIPMDRSREIVMESIVDTSSSQELKENIAHKLNWLNILKWSAVTTIFILATIIFFKH